MRFRLVQAEIEKLFPNSDFRCVYSAVDQIKIQVPPGEDKNAMIQELNSAGFKFLKEEGDWLVCSVPKKQTLIERLRGLTGLAEVDADIFDEMADQIEE